MCPALAVAFDLHAEHVVLAPVQRAAQIGRRQQLVVGVHPQHEVRAAPLDFVDEHVARLAEVPQLPVAGRVLPRRAGVDLREHGKPAGRGHRERRIGRAGVDDHRGVDDADQRREAARQVALLVLDDQPGADERLARQRAQHDVALSRTLHRHGRLDVEQVAALHAQLEQARQRVEIRMDREMAGREVALEAGDAVIGQADEHAPIVGDEPPQLRERRQRVVHVLEHVDHRDQREALGRGPLADLRIGDGFEIGHQHRHAERPRVVGHDLDVVHAERFAAELAQAMREVRILGADVERARRCAAQHRREQVLRERAVDRLVVRGHQVPGESAGGVLLVRRLVQLRRQRRLEPRVAVRTHPVRCVAETLMRWRRADRAVRHRASLRLPRAAPRPVAPGSPTTGNDSHSTPSATPTPPS